MKEILDNTIPWRYLLLPRQRFEREKFIPNMWTSLFLVRRANDILSLTFIELSMNYPREMQKKSLIMCSYILFFNFVLTVQYIKTIFKIVTCIFFKNIFFSSAWRKFLKTDHILGSKKNLFPKVEIGAFWRPQFTKQLETHN